MTRSRMHPDKALEISLNGTANRLVDEGLHPYDAIAQLRELAGGRADLLGLAAGSDIGGFLGRPGMGNPNYLLAAAYLTLAGADVDVLVENVDVVRDRVQRAR